MNITVGIGPNHTQKIIDFLNDLNKYINVSIYFNYDFLYSYKINFKNTIKTLDLKGLPYNYLLSYNNSKFDNNSVAYTPKGFTVNSIEQAEWVRANYPNCRIDISVNTPPNEIEKFLNNLELWDYINIKNWNNYNLKVIMKYTALNKGIKLIVDQGCFYKRDEYFEKNGFKFIPCNEIISKNDPGIHSCNMKCKEMFTEWKYLTCNSLNHLIDNFINYNKVEYKFATRGYGDEKTIQHIQDFFSNNKFNNINVHIKDEFIQKRLSCNNDCFNCQYCKFYYERYKC